MGIYIAQYRTRLDISWDIYEYLVQSCVDTQGQHVATGVTAFTVEHRDYQRGGERE
jgi:hypothetical protein